jgi:hypothetical protein
MARCSKGVLTQLQPTQVVGAINTKAQRRDSDMATISILIDSGSQIARSHRTGPPDANSEDLS